MPVTTDSVAWSKLRITLKLSAVSNTGVPREECAMNTWWWAEKWLGLTGVLLIGIFVSAMFQRTIVSRVALEKFENARAARSMSSGGRSFLSKSKVDLSLWSKKRIQAYTASLTGRFDAPLGVLKIPKLGLLVPVFEGTDELTLNRGVGRVAGTAQLGGAGNVGIAGHRDGFFRVLKDIAIGDFIEVEVENGNLEYAVQSLEVVYPNSTNVLQTRSPDAHELTLVTCYPFYFIGSAPQRFIVHARLIKDGLIDGSMSAAKR
jgi:sortase A